MNFKKLICGASLIGLIGISAITVYGEQSNLTIENGVTVKKYDADYIPLNESEKETVQELLVEYQNYFAQQNELNQIALPAEEYFNKSDYELILRNQRDHQFKYIPQYQEYDIDSDNVMEPKYRVDYVSISKPRMANLYNQRSNISIGEYSIEWLSTHTIQDYSDAGISVEDLSNLLNEITEYKNTYEYDWISSCLCRMQEDITLNPFVEESLENSENVIYNEIDSDDEIAYEIE